MSSRFSIKAEWEPSEGITTPELAATWSRLEIQCGGRTLTSVLDQSNNAYRSGIYVSAAPLAEWVAENWWYLVADARPVDRPELAAWGSRSSIRRPHWQRRHNLRAAADGFAWPNAVLVPSGHQMLVRWWEDGGSVPFTRTRFLGGGVDYPERDQVLAALADFVEATILRLEGQGLEGSRLASECAAIRDTDASEREFCIAVARLGLDPYALGPDEASTIAQHVQAIPSSLRTDVLAASSLDQLAEAATWVAATLTGRALDR